MGRERSAINATDEVARMRQVEHELNIRLQQQAAVVRLGQRALVSKDLSVLFDETVRLVAETLDVEFCKILELLPDGKELLLRAGVGWKEGLVGKTKISTGKGSQAGYTVQTNLPVIVADLREERRFSGPSLLVEHGVVSGLSVVIPGGAQPFGVLGAHSAQRRQFSEDDAQFLQSVSNLLASAIVRLKTEKALRTSRDQLGIILQGVADGITVQDPRGNLIFANNAAARITGFPTAAALMNAPLSELMKRYELIDEAGNPFPIDRLPGRLALAGVEGASALVRFRVLATGEEHWSLVKATPIKNGAGQVEMAVNIFQDVSDLKRTEWSQRVLAEAGKLLVDPLDYENTLASVAQAVVPNLADWCAVHILDERGEIKPLAIAHVDPRKVSLAQEYQQRYPPDPDAPTGIANVLRTGQPEFYLEIDEAALEAAARDAEHYRMLREIGFKSVILLPLVARDRPLGALTLVWSNSNRRYTQEDVALAEELARRAGLAIDNARLYRESQRLNAELEARVARRTSQLQAIITKLRNEIVDRQKAEEALRKSEALFQNLFDSAPDATILVDREGIVKDANSQVEAMFGLPRKKVVGKPVDRLFPKRFHKRLGGIRGIVYPGIQSWTVGADPELFGKRKDGSEFPIDVTLNPVKIENEDLVIAAIRNVSERKNMEAELAEVQRRLIDSAENERLHLAQELHDGPIQDLYAVSFHLKSLNEMAGEEASLQSTSQTLQRVIGQLRAICGELRPPALAPFGLEKAILAHLEQIPETNPELRIEHHLAQDGQELPERMRLILFRIFQHAVSNVLRHSQANHLSVRFTFDDRQVVLEVQDDGRGFELPARWVEFARKGHLGLVGTAERAESIGGRVDIVSSPGHGTLVRVTAPLSPEPGRLFSRGLFRFRTN